MRRPVTAHAQRLAQDDPSQPPRRGPSAARRAPLRAGRPPPLSRGRAVSIAAPVTRESRRHRVRFGWPVTLVAASRRATTSLPLAGARRCSRRRRDLDLDRAVEPRHAERVSEETAHGHKRPLLVVVQRPDPYATRHYESTSEEAEHGRRVGERDRARLVRRRAAGSAGVDRAGRLERGVARGRQHEQAGRCAEWQARRAEQPVRLRRRLARLLVLGIGPTIAATARNSKPVAVVVGRRLWRAGLGSRRARLAWRCVVLYCVVVVVVAGLTRRRP